VHFAYHSILLATECFTQEDHNDPDRIAKKRNDLTTLESWQSLSWQLGVVFCVAIRDNQLDLKLQSRKLALKRLRCRKNRLAIFALFPSKHVQKHISPSWTYLNPFASEALISALFLVCGGSQFNSYSISRRPLEENANAYRSGWFPRVRLGRVSNISSLMAVMPSVQ
jgi:hypothetical protein